MVGSASAAAAGTFSRWSHDLPPAALGPCDSHSGAAPPPGLLFYSLLKHCYIGILCTKVMNMTWL